MFLFKYPVLFILDPIYFGIMLYFFSENASPLFSLLCLRELFLFINLVSSYSLFENRSAIEEKCEHGGFKVQTGHLPILSALILAEF